MALLAIVTASPARAATGWAPVIRVSDDFTRYDVDGVDVLDDPGGNLDIEEVEASTAFRRAKSGEQPVDGGVRWYRFRAETPPNRTGWELQTNSLCNDADAYWPEPGGRYSLHPFGFSVPFADRRAPGIHPAIALPPLTGQTIFVRLRCFEGEQSLTIANDRNADVRPWLGEAGLSAIPTLVILALGLAIVTRTRAFALVAACGTCWWLDHQIGVSFPRLFPTLSFPPLATIYQFSFLPFLVAQYFFYDDFLTLRRRGRSALLASAAIAAATTVIFPHLPVAVQESSVASVAYPLLVAVFFATATWLGIAAARAGNRSAWFGAAGSGIYVVTGILNTSLFPFSEITSWLIELANPADTVLFIIGVGDQLRQSLLSNQKTLKDKEAAQSALLTLQESHIVDIERRNTAFARFVPSEFLRQLNQSDIVDVHLGDHIELEMAILFSDIRGFTTIAKALSPGETFEFLNEYLARAAPVIRAHDGFVDKFVGDAIVALFPTGARPALQAAVALQQEVRRFNDDRARNRREPIAIGVGVHLGRVMLGTIGETERIETTVIADAVNVASRLEGMTKIVGARIVTSEALVASLEDRTAFSLRPIGEVVLRGRGEATEAFEVYDGDPHDLLLHKHRSVEAFELGLSAYRDGAYARGREIFDGIARANPQDSVAAYLRDRSAALESVSPGERRNARNDG